MKKYVSYTTRWECEKKERQTECESSAAFPESSRERGGKKDHLQMGYIVIHENQKFTWLCDIQSQGKKMRTTSAQKQLFQTSRMKTLCWFESSSAWHFGVMFEQIKPVLNYCHFCKTSNGEVVFESLKLSFWWVQEACGCSLVLFEFISDIFKTGIKNHSIWRFVSSYKRWEKQQTGRNKSQKKTDHQVFKSQSSTNNLHHQAISHWTAALLNIAITTPTKEGFSMTSALCFCHPLEKKQQWALGNANLMSESSVSQ